MNLSKSKYCAGIQCPKILWMDKHIPEQFDQSTMDETRIATGHAVGELAKGYFGVYAEVPFDRTNIGGMISETRRLLEAGANVIAEASFSYDGNFCSVDILRKTDNGYEIVEVKSSTQPKDIYYDDMAFQYYVVMNNGLPVSKVSLMQLNNEYTRQGELDLQELFSLTDCTEVILRLQDDIGCAIAKMKSIATQDAEPKLDIGSHCKGCGYQAWCFRDLQQPNVYDIGFGMHGAKKDMAYQSGFVSFEDVFNSGTALNEMQLLQVKTAVLNQLPHMEPYSIRQFLNGLTYPLYHLDFETYQQAIPLWDGVKPYQQIPFQYSLHIQETPGAEPLHKEFLGKEGSDPRRAFAEWLCEDIPLGACVLAYSAGFEKGRIRELAELFPDLAEHLMNIHGGIKDLAEPFRKGYYYCREMGGSYSIKAVLPALFPDDPELDYAALNLIHNGSEAMNAFATLHEKTPTEIAGIREALLAYCRLDTLAMVRILDKLCKIVERKLHHEPA